MTNTGILMTDLFIGKVPGAISACLNSDHVYRKGKTVNKYIKRLWGIVIVLLSHAVLALSGRRESIWGYVVVIISIALFMYGAYVIAITFDKPFGKIGSVIFKILLCAYGAGLIYASCRFLAADNFSFRGALVFTILLIEGIAMFIIAYVNGYNSMIDGMQIVEGMEDDIDKLYNKFKDVDTPFGRPWVGTINPGGMKCLIYGPTENGTFLYGCYEMGTFFFGENENEQCIDQTHIEEHRLHKNVGGKNNELGEIYDLAAMTYPARYQAMFENYVKTGIASWTEGDTETEPEGSMYVFDERFKLTGQKYHLVDMDGNNVYDLEGTIPLKDFYIRDSHDGSELFRISKRLIHVFPHYDFYSMGEKYGSIRQEVKLSHDIFSMKTVEGKLVMKQVTATIGDNYAVYMDGRLIGTLSEKISLKMHDIVFDNFVLKVFDEHFKPLLTALAIMAEREQVRDRNGVI